MTNETRFIINHKTIFIKLNSLKFKKREFKILFYNYYKHGKVQLQQIENIGLLVYYDNKDYYEFDLEIQRKKLIDELNSYGFDFHYDISGLDKLRTLYYGKEMYSKNQNGRSDKNE